MLVWHLNPLKYLVLRQAVSLRTCYGFYAGLLQALLCALAVNNPTRATARVTKLYKSFLIPVGQSVNSNITDAHATLLLVLLVVLERYSRNLIQFVLKQANMCM